MLPRLTAPPTFSPAPARRLHHLGACRFRDEIPNFARFRDGLLQNPSQFSRGKLFQWVKRGGTGFALARLARALCRVGECAASCPVCFRQGVFEAVCSSVLLSPRVPISKWLPLHPALVCAVRSPPASTARSGRMRAMTLRVLRVSSTTVPRIWRRHSMPWSGSVLSSASKRRDPIGLWSVTPISMTLFPRWNSLRKIWMSFCLRSCLGKSAFWSGLAHGANRSRFPAISPRSQSCFATPAI